MVLVRLASRPVLAVVVACAISGTVAAKTGYVEAVGTLVGLLSLSLAAWMPRSWRGRALLRVLLGLLGAALMWGVAVDRSYYIEDCVFCGSSRDVVAYRLFGVAIWSRPGRVNLGYRLPWVARDLGIKCRHQWVATHVACYWGLIYKTRPEPYGVGITMGWRYYAQRIRPVVRKMRAEDPDLARKFAGAMFTGDRQWLRRFWAEVYSRAEAPGLEENE